MHVTSNICDVHALNSQCMPHAMFSLFHNLDIHVANNWNHRKVEL